MKHAPAFSQPSLYKLKAEIEKNADAVENINTLYFVQIGAATKTAAIHIDRLTYKGFHARNL